MFSLAVNITVESLTHTSSLLDLKFFGVTAVLESMNDVHYLLYYSTLFWGETREHSVYINVLINFLYNVIQKSNTADETVRTNIPTSASSEDNNLLADPDEAIRRRLAELRTDDSSKG